MPTPVADIAEVYRTTGGRALIVAQVDGSGNAIGDATTRSTDAFLSTAAVRASVVKASAGKIFSMNLFNSGAGAVYFRLYNKATTPGTGDTPVFRGTIPATGERTVTFADGLYFSTGIGIRITGAVADNDATALNANEVMANIVYE